MFLRTSENSGSTAVNRGVSIDMQKITEFALDAAAGSRGKLAGLLLLVDEPTKRAIRNNNQISENPPFPSKKQREKQKKQKRFRVCAPQQKSVAGDREEIEEVRSSLP